MNSGGHPECSGDAAAEGVGDYMVGGAIKGRRRRGNLRRRCQRNALVSMASSNNFRSV